MGVSFLAPLFLAGLAALAVPIVLHLRRRREGREVEFPSVMFLRDTPDRSERRSTIRNPWLLALRVLALALLAFAFARPLLDGESEAVAAAGPREVVVLLDRSWSMAHGDRWERARAAVEDVTRTLRSGDRSTLVLFDEEATAPLRSVREPARLRRAVEDAEPGAAATRLAPALRLARSVLEASGLPRREVVLVSDFQAGGWSAEDPVRLPGNVTLVPRPVGSPDGWSNLSVTSLEVRRERTDGRDVAVPTARVVRRGSGDGAGAVASTVAVLEVDGRERERIQVELDGGATTVEFGPVELGAEPLRATVRIEEDALPPDDVRHRVLAPGRRISVLVVEGSTRPNASLYLRRALEVSPDPPIEVEVVGDVPSSARLAGVDVVVLNDRIVGGGERARLHSWIEAGGAVLAAPGTAGETSGEAFGTAVGGPREPEPDGALRLGELDREHPVFRAFREAGTGSFFDTRFFRVRRLQPADDARVLARFDDRSPALVERRIERGRALVWAATLDSFWSDLPVQPVYLPFVQRAVLHLADRSEAAPAYRVGDVLGLAPDPADGAGVPPPDSGERWAAVRTPGGELVEVDAADGPLRLREAGFWELLTDPDAEEGTPVAVNVDSAEGDLTRRDPEEVAAAVTAPSEEEAATAGAPAPASGAVRARDRERHQGLWRFLLGAAFVLLVGETLVSNVLVPARRGAR